MAKEKKDEFHYQQEEVPDTRKSCIRSFETSGDLYTEEMDPSWKAAGGGWWKILKPIR